MDARLTAGYSPSATLKLTVAFFAGALFTSAGLLFWVQPLIAKMLLPWLGGAPSVWNTCMVFFQALLLAGYAYVLVLSRLKLRRQILVHVALLIVAGFFLPFSIDPGLVSALPSQSNPTLWLLKVLALTVGVPFFVLSATAPLLQRWFSHSDHAAAKDPYFLYAVSNAGSMLSLLAFPFLLEPRWNLGAQSGFWAIGYLVLALLIGACALLVGGREVTRRSIFAGDTDRVSWHSRLQWIALALIPSSLMLGVTTHISTDVASMPLIWIIPLALYLLTFILAFANKQVLRLDHVALLVPAAVIGLGFIVLLKPPISVWAVIGLHLAVFFLIAFTCHRRIALSRPSVNRLAEYYLCISIGGVLGGIFNALVAPLIFSTPLEYPLIMIAACMALPGSVRWNRAWLKLAFPVLIGVFTFALTKLVPTLPLSERLGTVLVVGLPLVAAYLAASRQRVAFALSLLAILAGSYWYLDAKEFSLTTQRNFFGVWRVSSDPDSQFHRLRHGSTTHGWQFTDEAKRCSATTYFSNDGPVGQVFQAFHRNPASNNVAVVGLGAGTLATYSRSNQQWDFYEIDPAIVRLAQDTRYFSYLSDCSPARPRIVLGDARLKMKEAPENHYGMLVMDAFSSDSVPAHLVTVQAMDLYLSKLAPDGLFALNISNRYLDLEPLLLGLAREKGMAARIRRDPDYDPATAKFASSWVVMSRNENALGEILNDPRWRPLKGRAVVWTDDFSNILDLMK
jgi:spermidine synthase